MHCGQVAQLAFIIYVLYVWGKLFGVWIEHYLQLTETVCFHLNIDPAPEETATDPAPDLAFWNVLYI